MIYTVIIFEMSSPPHYAILLPFLLPSRFRLYLLFFNPSVLPHIYIQDRERELP